MKKPRNLVERLRAGSFPPAAVAGALASFANDALGSGSAKPPERVPASVSQVKSNPDATKFRLQYRQSGGLKGRFQKSLSGIAIGPGDRILVLGDGEVQVFESTGDRIRSWKAPESASCLAVGRDERVYIGAGNRIQLFDNSGVRQKTIEVGEAGRPANVTAIKVRGDEILVADAAARCILRYDHAGKHLGEIGNQNKTRGFLLPNKALDIDVDSRGTVVATDSGRHRVSAWTMDGGFLRQFGKFGLANPEDFVGCCNPVNLAFLPEGRIATAEKVVPRVKVFDSTGKLLAIIGPEHFDAKNTHLYLAVDSSGRILVADPVRLEVKMFTVAAESGRRENV